jgi:hypothetical protein
MLLASSPTLSPHVVPHVKVGGVVTSASEREGTANRTKPVFLGSAVRIPGKFRGYFRVRVVDPCFRRLALYRNTGCSADVVSVVDHATGVGSIVYKSLQDHSCDAPFDVDVMLAVRF